MKFKTGNYKQNKLFQQPMMITKPHTHTPTEISTGSDNGSEEVDYDPDDKPV